MRKFQRRFTRTPSAITAHAQATEHPNSHKERNQEDEEDQEILSDSTIEYYLGNSSGYDRYAVVTVNTNYSTPITYNIAVN